MSDQPLDLPEKEHQEPEEVKIDPPPVFKSWSSWYWLLVGTLVFLILCFELLTYSFS